MFEPCEVHFNFLFETAAMSVVSALEAFVSTLPPNSDSLVVLSSGKKGDQADLHAIEGNVVFLKTMLETLDFKIADYLAVFKALLTVNTDGKLTGSRSRLEARTWCHDQSQKCHHLLSYTVRLCRRSNGTNSYCLGTLKEMYNKARNGRKSDKSNGQEVGEVIDLDPDEERLPAPLMDGTLADPAPSAISTSQASDPLAGSAPQPLPHPDAQIPCTSELVELIDTDDELPPDGKAPHEDIANGQALNAAAPQALAAITQAAKNVAPVAPKPKAKKASKKKSDPDGSAGTPQKAEAAEGGSKSTPQKEPKERVSKSQLKLPMASVNRFTRSGA